MGGERPPAGGIDATIRYFTHTDSAEDGRVGAASGAWLDAFPGSEPQDAQAVVTSYSARGTVKSVGGSYGTLVAGITRRADGLVTNLVYGDSAGTQTSTTYDDRRRPTSIQTYRASSALWSAFAAGGTPLANITYSPPPSLAGTPTNFQMLLEDTDIAYDEVGNPIELRDWREPSEWPANNKPVTKKIEYDDLYRVRRMDYLYSTATGTDGFQSPYTRENTEGATPTDPRRAKPAPHLSFANRPLWQKFEYDWLGNLSETDDDAHGFYDRSLGTQSHANAGKPYQLSGATNSTHAASSGASGGIATLYDVTGNLRAMTVARSTARLSCRPSGSGCNQYYAYDYDEVGRLVRARRWDSATAYPAPNASNLPAGSAQIELRYRYDASDQRVIKRVFATNVADQRHTLYVFGSLEVRRTAFAGDAYTISNVSLVPYAMANGVRLARLHYSEGSASPQVAGTGLGEQAYRTNTAATLHVLLELGDHLGSTGTVLDKLTSELVEKTTYLPFGARENDYRGTDVPGGSNRWSSFREDYGFTGKEEDVEVGLTYFGKRFLSPQLGRWVTADPLAVHMPGNADFNLYAYVSGAVLKSIDPVGLEEEGKYPRQPEPGKSGPPPSDAQIFWLGLNSYLARTIGRSFCSGAGRELCNAYARTRQSDSFYKFTLAEHYMTGHGKTYKVTSRTAQEWLDESERRYNDIRPLENETFYQQYQSEVQKMQAEGRSIGEFRFRGKTDGEANGPGRYSLTWDVKATIRATPESSEYKYDINFAGTVRLTDRFDFDPTDPGLIPSGRPYDGELATARGQAIDGAPFDIASDELMVEGGLSRRTVVSEPIHRQSDSPESNHD